MLGPILLTVWFVGACLVLWFLPSLLTKEGKALEAVVADTTFIAILWFLIIPFSTVMCLFRKFISWRISCSNRTKSLQKPSNSQDVV